MTGWHGSGKTIVINRGDVEHVHDYARSHCDLRDYLFIRLPMKIGLRTSEIATLRIENIDFEKRSFKVLDSKKKSLFPLPLDMVTLQYIQDLIGQRPSGYVFRQHSWRYKKYDKPLSRVAVWHNISKIGKVAGVQGFSPRVLRHYFAANWYITEKKNIEMLRRIMRHANLAVTHLYLCQLVFWEDVQKEYDGVKNDPVVQEKTKPVLNEIYQKFCARCDHEPVCNIKAEVCASEWASGCKYCTANQQAKMNGPKNHKLSIR